MRLEVLILETFILVLMKSCTENYGKNLISWKILIRSFIVQIIMIGVSINMVLNAEHRILEQMWILKWYFKYWLGRRCEDDERQVNRYKKVGSMFRGKLVKMIKDNGSKFYHYSISPKLRQISLHWDYELTEKYFFVNSTN